MIFVTAMAALVLFSVVAFVVYKTRNQQNGMGQMIREQAEEDAVTSSDQLDEMRDQADKLTAAGQPPGMRPRLAG